MIATIIRAKKEKGTCINMYHQFHLHNFFLYVISCGSILYYLNFRVKPIFPNSPRKFEIAAPQKDCLQLEY